MSQRKKHDDGSEAVGFVIGVTGPRSLTNRSALSSRVREVFAKFRHDLSHLPSAQTTFVILSPLAEGADRLVAWAGFEELEADLEVVLPLKRSDYRGDFDTAESKAEFEALCARARRIIEIEPAAHRAEAYERAGRYVVDHCDVLIALWDGKPASGRGGTGDIVAYAREVGCPLYWIHTEDGRISEEPGSGLRKRHE
jgi:hypothetical protein